MPVKAHPSQDMEIAQVFHDGRRLFIRIQGPHDVENIQRLLLIEKNLPRKKSLCSTPSLQLCPSWFCWD
jgi:hypothetical protein